MAKHPVTAHLPAHDAVQKTLGSQNTADRSSQHDPRTPTDIADRPVESRTCQGITGGEEGELIGPGSPDGTVTQRVDVGGYLAHRGMSMARGAE